MNIFSETILVETNQIQNSELCFVTVVFPIVDDSQLISVKNSIKAAVAELEKVKVEIRITEIRDGV